MDLETILFEKDGFKFIRVKKNHYKLLFSIENKNIILPNIIDFNLIKLIYDLNPDIYEKVNIDKLNENKINFTLLTKHLFEDLGLPQRFCFINMLKIVEDNKIKFHSKSIKTHRPKDMPEDSELLPIYEFKCICTIITPHKIDFLIDIIFEPVMFIPPFLEKMIGMMLHKMFKRVKQFIENMSI